MKLGQRSSPSSFYESFSDLLFGTLVLFVVLVMGMALEMRSPSASPTAIESKDGAQGNGKFVGGSDTTYCFLGYLPSDRGPDEGCVVWVPRSAAHAWFTDRDNGRAMLTTWGQDIERDGLAIMPLRDLIKMKNAVGVPLIKGAITQPGFGYIAHLARAIAARGGKEGGPAAAIEIVRRLSAVDAAGRMDTPPDLRMEARAYFRWSTGGDDANSGLRPWTERVRQGDERVYSEMLREGRSENEDAFLRFTAPATRGDIRVGDANVTPEAFRGMLRSIVPGDRFFLEHRAEGSDRPSPPPHWVVKDILEPVGFGHAAN